MDKDAEIARLQAQIDAQKHTVDYVAYSLNFNGPEYECKPGDPMFRVMLLCGTLFYELRKARAIGDKLAAYLSEESRQYNLLASYPEEENFICSVCGKGPHAEDCALINALKEWEEAKQ